MREQSSAPHWQEARPGSCDSRRASSQLLLSPGPPTAAPPPARPAHPGSGRPPPPRQPPPPPLVAAGVAGRSRCRYTALVSQAVISGVCHHPQAASASASCCCGVGAFMLRGERARGWRRCIPASRVLLQHGQPPSATPDLSTRPARQQDGNQPGLHRHDQQLSCPGRLAPAVNRTYRTQLSCLLLLWSEQRDGLACCGCSHELLLRHLARLPHSRQALADLVQRRPKLLGLSLQLLGTLSSQGQPGSRGGVRLRRRGRRQGAAGGGRRRRGAGDRGRRRRAGAHSHGLFLHCCALLAAAAGLQTGGCGVGCEAVSGACNGQGRTRVGHSSPCGSRMYLRPRNSATQVLPQPASGPSPWQGSG